MCSVRPSVRNQNILGLVHQILFLFFWFFEWSKGTISEQKWQEPVCPNLGTKGPQLFFPTFIKTVSLAFALKWKDEWCFIFPRKPHVRENSGFSSLSWYFECLMSRPPVFTRFKVIIPIGLPPKGHYGPINAVLPVSMCVCPTSLTYVSLKKYLFPVIRVCMTRPTDNILIYFKGLTIIPVNWSGQGPVKGLILLIDGYHYVHSSRLLRGRVLWIQCRLSVRQ